MVKVQGGGHNRKHGAPVNESLTADLIVKVLKLPARRVNSALGGGGAGGGGQACDGDKNLVFGMPRIDIEVRAES
jgi:hypothetical protein